MTEVKNVFIKNNIGCYFSIELTDYSGMNPSKFFIMERPEQEIPVPLDYALSIFVEPHAKKAYEKGDFIFTRNKEQFLQEAINLGLITKESNSVVEENSKSPAIILAVLKAGNKEKIKDLLESSNNKDKTIQIAIDNKNTLPLDVINFIEEKTQIAIIND